jgi:hypothetical protein
MSVIKKVKEDDLGITWIVKYEDVLQYISYSEFIENLCKEKKNVPLRVFQKFLRFQKPLYEVKENYYKAEADKYVTPVLERYGNNKLYKFINVREVSDSSDLLCYSFNEMIKETIEAVIEEEIEK